VTALSSRFAWDGSTLALSGIDAQLAGGGRASGNVALNVNGGTVKLDLAVANVDLSRLQGSLIATRLSGTLAAEAQKDRQVIRADVRQADLALAFAAVVEGRKVTVERVRAQAGGGTFSGSGTLALDNPRAFTLDAQATRFNPARFVAMPEAQLDGKVRARGTLASPFAIDADLTLDKGSKFAGLDVAGTAHAEVTPTTAKQVAVDLSLGTATVALKGGYGTASDSLAYDVNVPRLAQLRPLAVRYAKFTVADPIAGSLRARGTISGDPRNPGIAVDAHGEGLEWGRSMRVGTLDIAGSIAPGRSASGALTLSERPISATVSATRVAAPQGALASVKATLAGTLAQHKATLAATGEDIDLAASATGGLSDLKRAGGTTGTAWSGTVDTLANRGTYAVSLEAPAAVVVARDHVEVGLTRIAVAEGRVDLVSLVVDEGRITSQGSFTGVPVASAAKLGGTPLPFASTLVIGGDWSLAATPKLNGTVNLRRERGDWFATESTTLDPSDLSLGITVLELAARFNEDALAATARFRSARAGTADASATLAAGRLPGRIDTTAPFTATLVADLGSLKPLQPWLGTVAVMDGRAHIDVKGSGTLADPVLAGTLEGDALRFDLPQYGVHLKDGKLRARLVDRSIALEEFSFVGGAGRFTAKGTLARAAAGSAVAGARVEWQAENFTIVNRPDLRLVADGKGTITHEGKKLALAGSISIDEGRVEYEPQRVGTLSDDVVIVGQPRKTAESGMRDLPLALDLEVTLGRDFRFSGEGLDTRLAGRVHVVTSPSGTLTAKGSIRAVSGTYYVFGQRLDIDRGRLLFDGPVDNPALDVVALRKNLAVEAGVELTGTVKVPRVRLVSNPPVPDGEKLSWLLTGQGLDRAGRGDLALLGAASASLLGQGKKPITTQIANQVGLDDISVRDSGTAVTTGQSTQVVAFGKRISDKLSLVYEQGLTVASNALRIEYALTRTITLRAEAGTISSLGLYYRRSYD
jgi:translocation and assembly module TamB